MFSKTCTLCKEALSIDNFWYRDKKAGTRMSRCKKCLSKLEKEHRQKNPKKYRDRWKRHYHRPEVREKRLRQHKEYFNSIEGRYEIALKQSRVAAKRNNNKPCRSDIAVIKAAFSGACEVCGKTEAANGRRLSLDHDHKTGDFRGWLCWTCNATLGLAQDSPEILKKAAGYLESSLSSQIKASSQGQAA